MWPLRATERHFGEVKMSANIEKIDIDIALRFPPPNATVWNRGVYEVYASIIICIGIFSYTLFIYQIFYH